MPIWERAHAYHVNKTAIMNLNVGVQLQLDTLGSQLNMSSVIDGCKADWLDYYQEHWMDFQHNLTILSFHDSAGRVIPSQNCSTAADPLVLKPIQDGNLDQCRPSDIRFVRVQLSLDFAHLITAPQPAGAPPPLTLLRTDYYIELPQTAVQLQNGLNQPYQLVTYTGPADLRLMSVEEVRRVILVPSLQDSPISLLTADFNLPGSVRTDSTAIVETITNKILKLAFNQICATLFSHLCPSYTDQPYAAVEVIKQSYIDADGNRISSRVFAYHHRMLLAMRPFAANKTLPVSVCNKFIDGLDPRLSQYFEGFYPDHHKIHDLNGQSQRTHFELIYIAAMKAEQAYRVAGDTAHEAVGQTSGQSFNASAYPSQAESTFAKYADPNSAAASSSRSRQGSNKCFGCGSPDHLWMDSNKNIICPKCDNPKIQKAAKDNFKAFRKSRKAAAQAKADKKREFNYDDLDEENKAKVKKQVFEAHPVEAASVVSSITLPSTASPSSPSASNPSSRVHKTFVCYVPVMTVAPAKRILPVQVDTAFPHIELPLGHIDGDQFPGIMGMVDSCAACTTGNFHYIAKIAKMYPHTLVRLYAPEDYSPIILSGVVSKDAIPVTTDLTIAFEFHIPFLTRDGSSASIIIAVGPDVSVNVIFGLPFIKTTGGILDLVSDRFEVHNLVSEPFPVVYLRSRNFVPKDDGHPPPSTQYQNIIQEITRLEQYVTQVLPAPDRSVSFGPTTIGSPGQQLHATSLSGSSPDSIVRWVPPTSTGFNHDDYYDPLLRNSDIEI